MTVQKLATWHLRQAIVHWKSARAYTERYDNDIDAFRAIFGVEERTKHANFHFEAHEIIVRLAGGNDETRSDSAGHRRSVRPEGDPAPDP